MINLKGHFEKRREVIKEDRYYALFESAPISLWEMDYSVPKAEIDQLLEQGVDIDVWFHENPRRIIKLVRSMKVLDVNARTLQMFQSTSKDEVIASTGKAFTTEAVRAFAESVKAYARGESGFETETVARTLDGRSFPVFLSITFPLKGLPADSVIISFSDISKRKDMEAKLLKVSEKYRALSQKLMNLQEDERRMIASELHDALGQSLTYVATLAKLISNQPENRRNREYAESINESVQAAFKDVRSLLVRIRPAFFDTLGLCDSIKKLVQGLESGNGIQCRLDCSECGGWIEYVDETLKTAIYRAIQEGLTNIARHADADHVDVKLWSEPHGEESIMIRLEISDDGKGVDLSEESVLGLGLLGMQERIIGVKGCCDFITSPGNGMTVSIQIPSSCPIEAS